MKKLIVAVMLGLAVGAASAADVSVSGVRDYAGINTSGARVALSTGVALPVLGATSVGVEATRVDQFSRGYTSYAATLQKSVVQVGPVDLAAKVAVGYIDPINARNGSYAAVGAVATLPVTKSLAVVGSVERRYGQDRVQAFDGNVASVGLKYSF